METHSVLKGWKKEWSLGEGDSRSIELYLVDDRFLIRFFKNGTETRLFLTAQAMIALGELVVSLDGEPNVEWKFDSEVA